MKPESLVMLTLIAAILQVIIQFLESLVVKRLKKRQWLFCFDFAGPCTAGVALLVVSVHEETAWLKLTKTPAAELLELKPLEGFQMETSRKQFVISAASPRRKGRTSSCMRVS